MANFEGFFLGGILEGFKSEAWRNDPTKFNHRVGISRVYQDSWGNETKDVVEVDVPMESVEMIQKQCAMLKGKPVLVRVIPMAKTGGRTGAWLSVFIPKGENLRPQVVQAPESQPQRAAS